MLEENAGNMDGRLMLIDQDGKVQYDTLREMSGCRVQIDEVRRVLTGMAEQAYGIPSQGGAEAARLGGSDYSGQIAYSVHAMDAEDGQVGALLYNGGYVKDTYIDAVVGRELEFPTGLILKDIQIAMPGEAVSVLRCQQPYAAFVFLNPALADSVSNYLSMLIDSYAADRHTTLEALEQLRRAGGDGR